jgi:hypothetical protein
MPGHSDSRSGLPDFRVVIRNGEGKYLAQDDYGLFFTQDRSVAVVLHYHLDHVAEQIETLRQKHGLALTADPVPTEEIYETCDCCQELFMPFMTFFDGNRFLCADCRRKISPRSHMSRPRRGTA